MNRYTHGIELQYTVSISNQNNHDYVNHTNVDFHNKVLQFEEFLKNKGASELWSMIAGSCNLRETCKATTGQLCAYPDKARKSIEAVGYKCNGFTDTVET